jgi:predicted transcriptional regulator
MAREETVHDKTGREIMRGDVVKVYHFTAALRRERHYMFKQALGIRRLPKSELTVMDFSHLNMTDEHYHEWADGRFLDHFEIVQSVDAKFYRRPRKARP